MESEYKINAAMMLLPRLRVGTCMHEITETSIGICNSHVSYTVVFMLYMLLILFKHS